MKYGVLCYPRTLGSCGSTKPSSLLGYKASSQLQSMITISGTSSISEPSSA